LQNFAKRNLVQKLKINNLKICHSIFRLSYSGGAICHYFKIFAKVIIFVLITNNINSQNTAKVSWYGKHFHKKQTASGEIFSKYKLTAANNTLPFGTEVLLINPKNNRYIIVRINDRGAFKMDSVGNVLIPLRQHPKRLFDLSMAAFTTLSGKAPLF